MAKKTLVFAQKSLPPTYRVATIRRLLKIIGLFCRIWFLSYGSFAKETCNLKEPTNRSHPIAHTWKVEQSPRLATCAVSATRSKHTATYCNNPQHTSTTFKSRYVCCLCNTQQAHCNTLQHPATTSKSRYMCCRCNILQHPATHCNTLPPPPSHATCAVAATYCNTLQHTATPCHHLQVTLHVLSLQHTATHCNTLQHSTSASASARPLNCCHTRGASPLNCHNRSTSRSGCRRDHFDTPAF